jgi:Flp pilus assembly pilin Flp
MRFTSTQPTRKSRIALLRWCRDEQGVTAIEYALVAALIVIGAMGAFTAFGVAFADFTTDWTNKILAVLN